MNSKYLDILKERTNLISCANDVEWHKARKLSSTRASAILGSNPYMSNVDVWEVLSGKRKDKDISDNPNVIFGLEAEKHIRGLFGLDAVDKYEVIDPAAYDDSGFRYVYSHKEKPYLTASTDGFVIDKENGSLGVLEIKTTNVLSSVHKESWKDAIPQNYYVQLLHEIMVCGADFGILVAYLRYSDYSIVKAYKVNREEVAKEINELYDQEVDFYENYISKGKKPPLVINL